MNRTALVVGLLCLFCAFTTFAQIGTPPTPTNLKAVVVQGDGITVKLTWDASGLWGYQVYRSEGDNAHFQKAGVTAIVKEFEDSGALPGKTYYYYVTAITLSSGGQVIESSGSNIVNVTLPNDPTKGAIAGRVTDAGTGNGIPWVQIQIFLVNPAGSSSWIQVLTDLSGNYQTVLEPGTYILHAQPPYVSGPAYVAEWYDNAPDSAHATQVVVSGGASVAANFSLSRENATGPKGTINGTVVDDATKAPIPNTLIVVLSSATQTTPVAGALTDQQGHYEAIVDTGTYVVKAVPLPGSGYQSEWFDNVTDPAKATKVEVASGKTSTADFGLSKTAVTPGPSGKIAGTVTADVGGLPIAGVLIHFTHTGITSAWRIDAITDKDGHYEATLDTGTYYVQAVPAPGSGYAAEWYDNTTDPLKATPVKVAEGKTVTADIGLAKLTVPPVVQGIIEGTVIDDATNLAIPLVSIRLYRTTLQADCFVGVLTDLKGHYQAVVDTGTYLVQAVAPYALGYRSEWYDNATDPSGATKLAVTQNSTVTANFGLAKLPSPTMYKVEGTVRDAAGNALSHAAVAIVRTIQEMGSLYATTGVLGELSDIVANIIGVGECRAVVWAGFTDANGNYSASVAGGKSYIALASMEGYLPQYYNKKSNPLDADLISVQADVKGIDFSLTAAPSLQNSISGVVRDAEGHGVQSRIVLTPVPLGHAVLLARFANTDAAGVYTIANIAAGKYMVLAIPFSAYAPTYYKKGTYGVIGWQNADAVEINGAVTGIDIGVVPIHIKGLAQLIGHIKSKLGTALCGVRVLAVDITGDVVGCGVAGQDGTYLLDRVPTGPINVIADLEGYTASDLTVPVAQNVYAVGAGDLVMQPTVVTRAGDQDPVIPGAYALRQNFPNPFNPSTTISFDLPAASVIRLSVFNVLGQEVATLVNGTLPAGSASVVWDGKDNAGCSVATGMYLYRLSAVRAGGGAQFTQVRRMLLVK